MESSNIFKPEGATAPADQPRSTLDWTILFQWILATVVGWLLGLVMGGEIGIGVFVGAAQWVVLRRYISGAGWWILATTVGWLLGWVIITSQLIITPESGPISSIISGALLGTTLGLAQWLVLRGRVNLASLWILLSIPGWTIGLTGVLGSTLVGAAVGAVTGFALDYLLRFPVDLSLSEN